MTTMIPIGEDHVAKFFTPVYVGGDELGLAVRGSATHLRDAAGNCYVHCEILFANGEAKFVGSRMQSCAAASRRLAWINWGLGMLKTGDEAITEDDDGLNYDDWMRLSREEGNCDGEQQIEGSGPTQTTCHGTEGERPTGRRPRRADRRR